MLACGLLLGYALNALKCFKMQLHPEVLLCCVDEAVRVAAVTVLSGHGRKAPDDLRLLADLGEQVGLRVLRDVLVFIIFCLVLALRSNSAAGRRPVRLHALVGRFYSKGAFFQFLLGFRPFPIYEELMPV